MRQAVTNLLSNAISTTPSGGRIDVTITMRDGLVSCAFRDTGIGVPERGARSGSSRSSTAPTTP